MSNILHFYGRLNCVWRGYSMSPALIDNYCLYVQVYLHIYSKQNILIISNILAYTECVLDRWHPSSFPISLPLSHVFAGLGLPIIPHSTDSPIGINSSLTSLRTISCTIYKWKLSHTFLTSCNDTLWKQGYNACVAHLKTFHTTSLSQH